MKTRKLEVLCPYCCPCSSDLISNLDGFIETTGDDDDTTRRHHALLDSQRHFDEEDKSPEQIARDLTRRYVGRAAVRYTGDMNEVPQRLLMPSVHDASLWQVRVKVCESYPSFPHH